MCPVFSSLENRRVPQRTSSRRLRRGISDSSLPMELNVKSADELLQLILEALHLDPEKRDGFERMIRQYGDFRVQEAKAEG